MVERRRFISVIGAGQADEATYAQAREVGRLLAGRGWGVVCGGMDGVMAAACEGAGEAGGFTLGIVPGTGPQMANPHCSVVVPTGLGQARNVLVVQTGQGAIAIGGAAGTLSEIGHALKAGKPVVGLGSWQIDGVHQAATPEQAVDMLLELVGSNAGG